MNTISIEFKLPPRLAALLTERAQQEGQNIGAVVTEAIALFLRTRTAFSTEAQS